MKPWAFMVIGALALVYFFVPMAIGLLVGAARILMVLIGLAIEIAPFIIIGAIVVFLIKGCGKKSQ